MKRIDEWLKNWGTLILFLALSVFTVVLSVQVKKNELMVETIRETQEIRDARQDTVIAKLNTITVVLTDTLTPALKEIRKAVVAE